VYALARELNIESKDLLDLCKKAGFDVKNQLSSLEPEQRDVVVDLIKKGSHKPAPASPVKPVIPARADMGGKVPTLATSKREPEPVKVSPPAPAPAAPKPVETPVAATISETPPNNVAPKPTPSVVAPAAKLPETRPPATPAAEIPRMAPSPQQPMAPERPPVVSSVVKSPTLTPPQSQKVPDIGGGSRQPPRPPSRRPIPGVSGPRPMPPQPLKNLAPKEKKEEPRQKPIAPIPAKMLGQERPIRPEDLVITSKDVPIVPDVADDEDAKGKKGTKAIPGRDHRRQARQERAEKRKVTTKVEVNFVDGKLEVDEIERIKTRSASKLKRRHKLSTEPRKGNVRLELPITVRSLSEAVGIRSVELLFKLKEHGSGMLNINSVVEPAMAEVIALDFGCELEIRHPTDTEELLLNPYNIPDAPEDLVPRAPVVTIMGHVDHGKTSLLDKIRKSNVAATEAGGITQVIRAWRVEHGGRPVTFLDTPGHEAFTKMRARGAQVTDIAVIVVAADDGVMPQTEEAIQHARAAGVSLVICINKIDLPSANLNRTRQQLYSLNVLPDNMGGDTPFVETSAATGKGIDELLDQLSVVAELKELKANPKKPAQGTCLEANLSEGEGVQATLLVRDGTLRQGDVILCGASYGRVRQMYNDLLQPIEEAGPSVPVRITGLDEMPNADDPFQVLPDLGIARNIAEKRKVKLFESSQTKRVPLTLERLAEAKIDELKVILKADFRGSVEAIRKELEKLQHAEVRVKILKDGIGAITADDVWLALTSPEDTMIVGFNVVPDERARTLAEEQGVQIREYNIIYNLTNDIKAALEGKLKPREEVVNLGRAVVRDTFKISRVGTIAGCYVTQGVIRRNAKVRLIRDGVVIFPPPERTVGLDSLKRFKDDASEVREGFECGIKMTGYDDIKVGDVVEAYRVEQVQRTLDGKE